LDDAELALEAARELINRGWGKPPVAVLAQINGNIAVCGVVRPPLIMESDEEWLARRRRELGLLTQQTPLPASARTRGGFQREGKGGERVNGTAEKMRVDRAD
jgi:hypothetical protein